MGIKERKERERERRKQQIIVAAKRVFSEKGFNRATMEDIAREAELSPGTLYLYFKNKEELYASLSVRILQYINIRMEHVVTAVDTGPKEKLTQLIQDAPLRTRMGQAARESVARFDEKRIAEQLGTILKERFVER
jgi:AcrR family transcriptional regulator